jgi:hypothetical protein
MMMNLVIGFMFVMSLFYLLVEIEMRINGGK